MDAIHPGAPKRFGPEIRVLAQSIGIQLNEPAVNISLLRCVGTCPLISITYHPRLFGAPFTRSCFTWI